MAKQRIIVGGAASRGGADLGSDSFFDPPVVPIFRHVILGICKVHLHVQVIFDLVHCAATSSIATRFSDHKSGIIAAPEDLMKCVTALFALPGVHWHQTPELDGRINCGKRTAFLDTHDVQAWLDFVMSHCKFLRSLNEVSLTGFGLRLLLTRTLDLMRLVQRSSQQH